MTRTHCSTYNHAHRAPRTSGQNSIVPGYVERAAELEPAEESVHQRRAAGDGGGGGGGGGDGVGGGDDDGDGSGDSSDGGRDLEKGSSAFKDGRANKKWCKTCCLWRPLTSAHCSDCRRCVIGHDHHCGWVRFGSSFITLAPLPTRLPPPPPHASRLAPLTPLAPLVSLRHRHRTSTYPSPTTPPHCPHKVCSATASEGTTTRTSSSSCSSAPSPAPAPRRVCGSTSRRQSRVGTGEGTVRLATTT